MMTSTTASMTTCPPITADDMIRTIKRVGREMERLSPRRDRCVRVDLSRHANDALRNLLPPNPLGTLLDRVAVCGIECTLRFDIPSGSYLMHMADGSAVMHYRSGRKFRCLPDTHGSGALLTYRP